MLEEDLLLGVIAVSVALRLSVELEKDLSRRYGDDACVPLLLLLVVLLSAARSAVLESSDRFGRDERVEHVGEATPLCRLTARESSLLLRLVLTATTSSLLLFLLMLVLELGLELSLATTLFLFEQEATFKLLRRRRCCISLDELATFFGGGLLLLAEVHEVLSVLPLLTTLLSGGGGGGGEVLTEVEVDHERVVEAERSRIKGHDWGGGVDVDERVYEV